MPWVAACMNLLTSPVLGYCVAVRNLALQAGILQAEGSTNVLQAMAPSVDDKMLGEFIRIFNG